jgi:hypothetical protein
VDIRRSHLGLRESSKILGVFFFFYRKLKFRLRSSGLLGRVVFWLYVKFRRHLLLPYSGLKLEIKHWLSGVHSDTQGYVFSKQGDYEGSTQL